MSRALRLFSTFAVLALVFGAAPRTFAQARTAPIVGTWSGAAKADTNQMKIQITVREEKGKLTGAITTAHGDWPIVSVTAKDNAWTIVFSRGDADDTGSLTGTITASTFAGSWNNAPMAVGTFEVTRK